MLTHWNKLLNTDCTVMEIGPHTVYPIFRVGFTSLSSVCDKKYINENISECQHIDIMIRDPKARFVGGVNEYCRQNKLPVEKTWQLIEQGKLIDKHFAPQYMWLLHLYKFYKGSVTLLPFEHIKNITSVHANNRSSNGFKHQSVALLQPFVDIDYKLQEHYNETVELGEIVRRYKNVLS